MSDIRPRRSVLYLPASNARALEKARTLPCDAIILDLEDAVAPEAKAEARKQMVEAVSAKPFGPREVIVRVNAIDTPYGAEDLFAAAQARPDAILAPKIDGPATLTPYEGAIGGGVALWVMMETPKAILNAAAIAAKAETGKLKAFVMGTNDLAKDTGAALSPGRPAMQAALQIALLAARAHGVAAIDGVHNALDDEAGFEAECLQGRALGFDGKTLIHPKQIETANRVFAPSAAEVAAARAIVEAFADPENAGKGAIRVDGKMAERLHAQMAEKTLALHRACEAMGETA